MIVTAALRGFAFGFVGSLPIGGPIAVLVFSRGLQNRVRSAMCLGVGAAVAECGYAYLAFWGLASYLTRYSWIEPISRLAAAVLLTGLGLRFVRRRDREHPPPTPDSRAGGKRAFLLGLAIGALNPALILGWAAAVTALCSTGLVRFESAPALPFSIGACAGIAVWFATMLGAFQLLRERISRAALERTLRAMGVLLILLGLGFAERLV